MDARNCRHCNELLRGRADKKFCDPACRSAYNYLQQRNNYHTFNKINAVLRKNRSILAAFANEMGERKYIDKIHLEMQGFQFRYFTHEVNLDKKCSVRYCYDIGYSTVADSRVELVRAKYLT